MVDVRANEFVRINQLHNTVTKMVVQTTTEPCQQENTGNLSYEEIAALYNQFIQEYFGENKSVSYSGVIKMDDDLMASKQHQSFLDRMYLYKSAFKSFVTPLRIIWMTESAYELKTFNSVICEHILNCLF